jgi:hypothetical protein
MVTSVCTEDVDCTDYAQQIFRSFGRKTKNAYCTLWAGVVGFCSISFSHTGGVASAMK